MMKSDLTTAFFIICFFCCGFVTSSPVPPRPDQVEILLAFKNEFPSRNCSRMWKFWDGLSPFLNISTWTKDKDASSYPGVGYDNKTGVVTVLSLSNACISGTIQANSSLFKLQHLRYLNLSRNSFDSSPVPAEFGKLTSLEILDLSQNGFIGEVPTSISNLSRLTTLDLSYNKLTGRFPPLHNLTLLSLIDLSRNNFSGTIPSSLFTMPSLKVLRLYQNQLTDPLENISSSATSKLEHLDMARNRLSCRILEHVSKLANLTYLDLSFLNTTCTNNFDFSPLKSLQALRLSGNNITEFPTFIKTLRNLQMLDISRNRLEGKVPEWLWDLRILHISHNSLSSLEGSSKVILNSSLRFLDLSANAFRGSFPMIPPTISGILASNNHFTGGIPLSLCNATDLMFIDLSHNNFSGSILPCLMNTPSLAVLLLSNNNLTGRLPDIEGRSLLQLLDVGHNQISGKLSKSLVNCTMLQLLNVTSNIITDTFPFWLKTLPDLEVMDLRSNRFHGPLASPQHPLSFPRLLTIDISDNYFSGGLPSNYFLNWSLPMVNITSTEFEKIPFQYTSINFSGNKLEGQIPDSIGYLKSLMAFQLNGKIPQELATLSFLENIDVSHNKLRGQIPQSAQIIRQPKSSFEGNIDLCGLPLQKTCFKENGAPPTQQP